ncbi:MAG: sn-glycerol-3-phosphate ABC transporter ATP-binding protein UgpC [Gemmatimonadota bacterium]|nr:sn-glycerol-3-phosphate ABC transporter ATP-binding protein UgpC [Gemmatimonadota bacterium]
MAQVTLEGVRKVYDNGFVAVHGVDLVVNDGEFVVLVGPSGCGKSTTLRIVAGLESLSAGTLKIGDRVVNDVAPKERDIAMVFQNYALYPHMTVFENLAFALKLRKLPAAEIDERVRKAAELLGLTPILQSRPKQLSGGQRQRVAIGRAIVRDPQVFLFDEPLSNLDAKLRVQMRREIAKIHRRLSATMIYVTHDQVEAMTMGDRIVVMNAGRIEQVDTPLELYDHPSTLFVASFIGSPAMNFIRGTIENGRFISPEDPTFVFPLSSTQAGRLAGYEGKAVVAGIRPEEFRSADEREPAASARLALQLDAIEPLGNEVVIYASGKKHDITARMSPRPLPEPGSPIELAVRPERVHYFDAETALVIASAE